MSECSCNDPTGKTYDMECPVHGAKRAREAHGSYPHLRRYASLDEVLDANQRLFEDRAEAVAIIRGFLALQGAMDEREAWPLGYKFVKRIESEKEAPETEATVGLLLQRNDYIRALEKYGNHLNARQMGTVNGCLGDGIDARTGKPFCTCGFHAIRIALDVRDFAALCMGEE